jgi:hypothetical protein
MVRAEVPDINSVAWPNVLTNTLAAVYRADHADPTFRRARDVVMLEADAHGGTAEDGLRAIEVWEARGCLASAVRTSLSSLARAATRRASASRSAWIWSLLGTLPGPRRVRIHAVTPGLPPRMVAIRER